MNIFIYGLCALLTGAVLLLIASLAIAKRDIQRLEDKRYYEQILIYTKQTLRGFTGVHMSELENVEWPLGKEEPQPELIAESILDEIATYDIPSALYYIANNDHTPEKIAIRKRYISVLACVYCFEIPLHLRLVDAGAKKLYMNLLYTMRAMDAARYRDELLSQDTFRWPGLHWEHLELLDENDVSERTTNARYRLYMRYYNPLAPFIVQTLLQQSSAMILPLYAEFEKRLRKNFARQLSGHMLTSDDVKVVTTAVAIKLGLQIPLSYFLYTPLTAVLVETPAPPSDFTRLFKL